MNESKLEVLIEFWQSCNLHFSQKYNLENNNYLVSMINRPIDKFLNFF